MREREEEAGRGTGGNRQSGVERWQTQLRLTDIKICDVFRETEVGIDGLEAEGKGRFRAQDRAREGSQTVSVERAGERRVTMSFTGEMRATRCCSCCCCCSLPLLILLTLTLPHTGQYLHPPPPPPPLQHSHTCAE